MIRTFPATTLAVMIFMTSAMGAFSAEEEVKKADSAPQSQIRKEDLKTEKDRQSYAAGYRTGQQMKQSGYDLDIAILIKAVADGFNEAKGVMTQEEIMETIMKMQQERMKQMREQQESLGKESKAKGEAFLAENAKKEGVTVLPNGLQYKVLKSGDGPAPKGNDTIKALYTGKLIDGTVFDASERHNNVPIEFKLSGGVIQGWLEAAKLMRQGDKWQLYIPPDLAYGSRGAGDAIPPESVLIFDMEMVEVVPAQ